MRTIKRTGTKDEILLAKALWHLGYRYRKNNKTIFVKPVNFNYQRKVQIYPIIIINDPIVSSALAVKIKDALISNRIKDIKWLKD